MHEFTFDRVFGADSRQVELFEFTAKPIIQGAIDGYNGTLFCYGQTGSGKTHAMEVLHISNIRENTTTLSIEV